jgi:ADP-ribosylglycohydrolase
MLNFLKREIKPNIPDSVQDRIKGVIFGHAIGDAIGLGTEFLNKEQIKVYYPNGFKNFNQIISDKHRSRWKKGEWTDDTDQMLCILESIIQHEKVVENDIAKRIHDWAYSGGRGLGNTVYNVISSPKFIFEPHEVAKQVWLNSGKNNAANGAIMRTSIMGVWEFDNLENVKLNTEKIAKITHFDPRCVGSCFAVTSVISKLLQNETDCLKLTDFAIEHTKNYDIRIKEFLEISKNKSIEGLKLDEQKSIGYTLKTMGAGFWALQQNDFKKAILEIVNQGGDADTNGAVAGGILGAKLGFSGLPRDWIDGLLNKDKLNRLFDKLIQIMIKSNQIE